MSYHVTILRSEAGHRHPITQDEFRAAINALPDLRANQSTQLVTCEILRDGAVHAELAWHDGEIWTGNPDRFTLQVMLTLAQHLGARVRGDEFETYLTPEMTCFHPDDTEEQRQSEQLGHELVKKARRNQWILNATLIIIFGLLALLAARCERMTETEQHPAPLPPAAAPKAATPENRRTVDASTDYAKEAKR